MRDENLNMTELCTKYQNDIAKYAMYLAQDPQNDHLDADGIMHLAFLVKRVELGLIK